MLAATNRKRLLDACVAKKRRVAVSLTIKNLGSPSGDQLQLQQMPPADICRHARAVDAGSAWMSSAQTDVPGLVDEAGSQAAVVEWQAPPQPTATSQPLSVAKLEESLGILARKPMAGGRLIEAFATRCNKPCTDLSSVPANVDYHEDHCGFFCKASTPPGVLAMSNAVRAYLTSLTQGRNQAAVTQAEELLCGTVSFGPGSEALRMFAVLVAHHTQHARFPAKHLLVVCHPLEASDENDAGLRLQLARQPHIRPAEQPRAPFDAGLGFGALSHCNGDEFAGQLLSLHPAGTWPSTVRIHIVKYTRLMLDQYICGDRDTSRPRLEATGSRAAVIAPAPAAPAAADDGPESDSEADFVGGAACAGPGPLLQRIEAEATDEEPGDGEDEPPHDDDLQVLQEGALVQAEEEEVEGGASVDPDDEWDDLGVGQAAPPPDPARVFADMPGGQSSAAVVAAYGLLLQGALVKVEATGQPVGRFNVLHGRTLQCTCRRHKDCRLFKNYSGGAELAEAEATMVKWLVLGSCQDAAAHKASSGELQASWRRKPAASGAASSAGGQKKRKCRIVPGKPKNKKNIFETDSATSKNIFETVHLVAIKFPISIFIATKSVSRFYRHLPKSCKFSIFWEVAIKSGSVFGGNKIVFRGFYCH